MSDRPYTDLDIDYEKLIVERKAPRWKRKQQRAAEANGSVSRGAVTGHRTGLPAPPSRSGTSPAHAQGPPTRGHAPMRPKHKRVSQQRGGPVQTVVIPDRERKTLHREIKSTVAPGSKLFTDELASYNGLRRSTSIRRSLTKVVNT